MRGRWSEVVDEGDCIRIKRFDDSTGKLARADCIVSREVYLCPEALDKMVEVTDQSLDRFLGFSKYRHLGIS